MAAFLAIGLAWHVRRQSRYDQVLKVAGEEAEAAFLAGDYLAAADRAHAAAEAARILGDDSARGRAAVQLDREVRIWSRLALTPLDALVDSIDSAAKAEQGVDTAQAVKEFDQLFGGRTILIDAWVTLEEETLPVTEGNHPATKRRVPHVEWSLAGETCHVELQSIDESAFAWLDLSTPTRVLFGVELAGLLPPRSPMESWKIQIQPGSATLITIAKPLVRANWPTTEDFDPILAQQRKWIMGEQP